MSDLSIFTTEATKNLLLWGLLFGVCMAIAAVNIVHFHHHRSRWQEALAAVAGSVALVVLGFYAVNYSSYGYQVLFLASGGTSVELTSAYTAQMWLVNGSLMAFSGAMVSLFAAALGFYGLVRKTSQPALHTVTA